MDYNSGGAHNAARTPTTSSMMPSFSPLPTKRPSGAASLTPATAPAWITREAAETLLSDRAALATACSVTTNIALQSSVAETTAVLRLGDDKTLAARRAFDAAAQTVLDALQKQQQQQYAMDDDDTLEAVAEEDLPPVLNDWKLLETLREQSLDRTHNNKDYLKRAKSAGISANNITILETASLDGSTTAEAAALPDVTTSSTTSSSKPAPASDRPKFTRNTPACSAAALDHRFTSSRAILCAAGNLHFDALTPVYPGHEIDILDVPQNSSSNNNNNNDSSSSDQPKSIPSSSSTLQINLGAVKVEATTLGQRSISVAENAVRRSNLRYQYRKDNAMYDCKHDREFLQVENPFSWNRVVSDDEREDDDDAVTTMEERNNDHTEDDVIVHQPKQDALTRMWTQQCLPRLFSVLHTGAGHAIYHDVDFSNRHGRVADLLKNLTSKNDNYGPHLIITVEPELVLFAQEFYDINGHLGLVNSLSEQKMRVLAYQGSPKKRRKLRQYFSQAKGVPESPFQVVVTTYADFLADYLHFCQVPWEVVILDDGASWMSTAQGDHNSAIGTVWENGIWSSNDQHIGLAGTSISEWDFGLDVIPEAVVREACIGLTARHRMMTAAAMTIEQRQSVDVVLVTGLMSFVAPHFATTVREEWDRSRITTDAKSMNHFRRLVARSTIVHTLDAPTDDLHDLAVLSLTGKLESPERYAPTVPKIIFDDEFVAAGKISFGRRTSLSWLGPLDRSWLRYELGKSKLQHILDSMKVSNKHGAFCEEITTASSTTSSGATGQVAGSYAYRLAVCCGRHFGSEQGLRQHINALHAPPGTWLCRTCGDDCMTSQARTHHERSCGQPLPGVQANDQGLTVGATPTVGQGSLGNKVCIGKKKANRVNSSQNAVSVEEKDPDGSLRVPGYRGVWVNKKGKHFIKIDGKKVTEAGSDKLLWFGESDEAAKKYDELIRQQDKDGELELNFNADGSRSVYDDITPASTSGLGGSAVSVVPALSVINIKDLPPHVKPLLRDPRQTSRTGGNSKRHVYAYRGVCRQARKGHDRWQSQISFMGVNHYLGTFDSEWDAAAIYAWAHLILYGEEATRQAQKEGEEAAAAYEKEQKDIAEGKVPDSQSKHKKPKKPPVPKTETVEPASVKVVREKSQDSPKKRKNANKEVSTSNEKKTKTNTKACKLEKEAIGSTVAKGVSKALILGPRFEEATDSELLEHASMKIAAARDNLYKLSPESFISTAIESLRPCIPIANSNTKACFGAAILVGLDPCSFGWDLQDFAAARSQGSKLDLMTSIQMLAVEYDEDGMNEKFRSIIQGTVTILGRASETAKHAYQSLKLGSVPIGGTIGNIDCHVGGVPGSCSEFAACIAYCSSNKAEDDTAQRSPFMLSCLSDGDMVTLNGNRITRAMGQLPVFDKDIISVGVRVMALLFNS